MKGRRKVEGTKLKRLLVTLAVMVVCSSFSGWAGNERRRHDLSNPNPLNQTSSPGSSISPQQLRNIKALIDRAESLLREATTKEQIQTAEGMLLEAMALSEQHDVARGIARASLLLGLIQMQRTDLEECTRYNQKALAEARRAGVCSLMAAATKNQGLVHKMKGENEEAVRLLTEAMTLAEECSDKANMARILQELGQVCMLQGKYDEALGFLAKGLQLSKEIRNSEIEAYILVYTGASYSAVGKYPEALRYLEEALALGEKDRKPRVQLESLCYLGKTYVACGKYHRADAYLQKAMERAQALGDKRASTEVLLTLGELFSKRGRYTDALVCFQGALNGAAQTGISQHEARVLLQMGALFRSSGNYDKALEFLNAALSKFQRMNNPRGEAYTLNNIGMARQIQGNYEEALANFRRALDIYQRIGVSIGPAVFTISNLYLDLGQVEQAESVLCLATNRASQGRISLIKRDYPSAKQHYESLLAAALESRNSDYLFIAYTGLGRVYEATNNLPRAAECYRKAVECTEEVRSRIEPDEREAFFEVRIAGFSRTSPYEGLARVLTMMNKPSEAFKESEFTKTRVFAEALARRSQHTSFDIPPDILAQDRELSEQLAALMSRRQEAYERADPEVIKALDPQVRDMEEKRTAHIKMLREKYPLFGATKYPEPMDLHKTALKDDEWVLAYHVTDSGIIVYLTKGRQMVRALFKPIARDDLEALVLAFRKPVEVVSGKDNFDEKLKSFDLRTGKKLSDLLLSDILESLPKNATLLIVPDDSLGTLPFEMIVLNDGGSVKTDKSLPYVSETEFFGDRNFICYSQSVTALTLRRIHAKAKQSQSGLLAIADPIFQEQDERMTRAPKQEAPTGVMASLFKWLNLMAAENDPRMGGLKFQRLSMTGELAQSLSAMHKEATAVYTGLDASKDNFLRKVAPSLNQYDEVLFATHGYFGKDLPGIMEPVLVLTLVPEGTDGFLRMTEIMGLDMNADIVALTACQTGLGKRTAGEGTMGMGRAFQYAGARSVLMSLWSVSEVASVRLVKSFFENLRKGKSKSEALASARDEIRKKGFDHPFFWAGFILVGETN